MNNKGEVVGQSDVYMSYKNKLYKQTHAVKWINGKVIDLHGKGTTKAENSKAFSINDFGNILLEENGTRYSVYLNGGIEVTLRINLKLNLCVNLIAKCS